MPLSTVLGAQSLIKPGVCTTATRPSSPYTGQMIYDTTVSQTLVWNGSAWVVQTGGLVRVGGGSLSGAATTFSSVFSSTYDAYKIVLSNCTLTANAYAYMTLGSTTTGYVNYNPAVSTGGTYTSAFSSQGTTFWAPFFIQSTDYGATVDIINPYLAKLTYITGGFGIDTTYGGMTHSGSLNNTTQYTAFTLTQSSGTITGTVSVYGYTLS